MLIRSADARAPGSLSPAAHPDVMLLALNSRARWTLHRGSGAISLSERNG